MPGAWWASRRPECPCPAQDSGCDEGWGAGSLRKGRGLGPAHRGDSCHVRKGPGWSGGLGLSLLCHETSGKSSALASVSPPVKRGLSWIILSFLMCVSVCVGGTDFRKGRGHKEGLAVGTTSPWQPPEASGLAEPQRARLPLHGGGTSVPPASCLTS